MRRGDVFHVHWPSFSYTGSSFLGTLFKSVTFLLLLLFFRWRGIKIVWTVHNVWPHKGGVSLFNRIMRTMLCSFSTSLIVMGDSAKQELIRNFKAKERQIYFIPHGHYKDAYPTSGLNVRERYGIPDNAYVFTFLGRIAPYKGVEQLLASFNELRDEQAHLLIAGKPSEEFNLDLFKKGIQSCNVHVSLNYVKDEEIADYIRCADCVVLPYQNITTSGTAILALSCTTPVVAPNIGLLSDYLTPETSVLYDPLEAGALTRSMREVRAKKSFFQNAEPYRLKLEELNWQRISKLTQEVYSR
ncbi:hypothetical protein KCTCHS21_12090 [Cohnella abietis]|uniref:Glycosyl transferase family 1 domain-containing protein n=2 Tax=Cohnella abietis TaxID=2507935 RepID=A0A3T1D136_9BACL|nr:hypothetical protein KCTCHS21_12090 [Cohnella abietis]